MGRHFPLTTTPGIADAASRWLAGERWDEAAPRRASTVMLLRDGSTGPEVFMLRRTANSGKTAFFMSADKVKFRKPVRPGDQIIINAKLTKTRGEKLAAAECNCTVGGQVVSSAELMFALVEEAEE